MDHSTLDVTDAVNACSSLDVHPNAALSVASLLSKLEITALNAFIAFASFVLCSTVAFWQKQHMHSLHNFSIHHLVVPIPLLDNFFFEITNLVRI